MSVPALEDVTRQLVLQLQDELGSDGYCFFGEKTAIEVLGQDGRPEVEVQDRPRLQVTGPTQQVEVNAIRKSPGERVMVSRDTTAGTYVDAQLPIYYDLHFALTGWAMRQTSFVDENGVTVRGLMWLSDIVKSFGTGSRIKNDAWDADQSDWPGYYCESVQPPQAIPGSTADLCAFSATLRIRSVRTTDQTNDTLPIVLSTAFTVDIDPT